MKLQPGLPLMLVASSAVVCAWVALTDDGASECKPESTGEYERVTVRLMAREAIAWEVLEGRMSLHEGAAVFDWLNHQPPVLTSEALRRFTFYSPYGIDLRGLSEEGLLCHAVLGYACSFESAATERIGELTSEFRRTCETPRRFSLPHVVEPDCVELLERSREAWHQAMCAREPRRPTVSGNGLRFVIRAQEK